MTAHRIPCLILLLLAPVALSACGENQGDALTKACVAAAPPDIRGTPDVKSGCACVTKSLVDRLGDQDLSWFIDYQKALAATGELAPLTTVDQVNGYLLLAEANALCKVAPPAAPPIGGPN
jgi:hypothetical protein